MLQAVDLGEVNIEIENKEPLESFDDWDHMKWEKGTFGEVQTEESKTNYQKKLAKMRNRKKRTKKSPKKNKTTRSTKN
jgi:hypothetical protein